MCLWLRNGVVTSGSGFTVNINGLGAKPCYSSLAAAQQLSGAFNVNYTMLLIYNSTRVTGGCWDFVYGYDSNTTYSPAKLGFVYVNGNLKSGTTNQFTGGNSSYSREQGGFVAVNFTAAVPANSTLNINSKGDTDIYYRGARIPAGVIKNGDVATFVYYPTKYILLSVDRWGTEIETLKSRLDNLVVADNVGY